MKDQKKYDIKLNPDTATAEEIKKANEKLYEHLLNTGEKLAAKRVEGLIKQPEKPQDKKTESPVYGKLLKTNKDILAVLQKMQEDMIDEQDTSLKPKTPDSKSKGGGGPGGFQQYGLIGAGIAKLRGKDTGLPSGAGLLNMIMGGLFAGGGGLTGAAFRKAFKKFDPNLKDANKTKKDANKTKKDIDKNKKDLDKTKKDLDKTKKDVDKTKKDLAEEKKKRKTNKTEKSSKKGDVQEKRTPDKPEQKTTKAEKVETEKKVKADKVEPEKTKPESKKTKRSERRSKRKLKKGKGKPKTPSPKKLSKAVKGVPKKVLKKGGKTAVKAIGKGLAKGIPVLGWALAAGMAVNDGVDGWNQASDILDKPEKDLTVYDKGGAAAANMVSGLTLGIVDPKQVVNTTKGAKAGFSNAFGDSANIIDKYEGLGVLEHKGAFRESEIIDWKKLAKLPSEEIQKIIDIDDWDEHTLKALNSWKKRKANDEAKFNALSKKEQKRYKQEKRNVPFLSDSGLEKGDSLPKGNLPKDKGITPPKTKPSVDSPETTNTTGGTAGTLTSTGDVKEYIKKNEGLRLKPYQDSLGYPTIGYGHLIKPEETKLYGGITKKEADKMFEEDFKEHWSAAMKIPTFNEQPDEVQNVLADMTYNLGPKWWTKWPNTMRSLQTHDHDKMASGIENSLYYTQVGRRSKNNVNIIRNVATKENFAKVDKPANTTQVQRDTAEAPEIVSAEPVVPKSNKVQKEQAVASLSQNLNKETVNYETVQKQQIANVTQPVINNVNNNSSQDEFDDRILTAFS